MRRGDSVIGREGALMERCKDRATKYGLPIIALLVIAPAAWESATKGEPSTIFEIFVFLLLIHCLSGILSNLWKRLIKKDKRANFWLTFYLLIGLSICLGMGLISRALLIARVNFDSKFGVCVNKARSIEGGVFAVCEMQEIRMPLGGAAKYIVYDSTGSVIADQCSSSAGVKAMGRDYQDQPMHVRHIWGHFYSVFMDFGSSALRCGEVK